MAPNRKQITVVCLMIACSVMSYFDRTIMLLSANSLRSWKFLRHLTSLFRIELSPVWESVFLVQIDAAIETWENPLAENLKKRGVLDCRSHGDEGFAQILSAITQRSSVQI